jgi:universal stress protein A
MPFKKILCAVDFSEPAREAMALAARLARESHAELMLVHVWQAPLLPADSAIMLDNELLAGIVTESERSLATWKAELASMGFAHAQTKLLAGVPWDCIVRESASDPAYDLVVLGTHGRSGLKHVLLGSVAEKVLRHAACPVLVVRARPAA